MIVNGSMGVSEKWIEELYLKIGGTIFLYFQNQNHNSEAARDLLQETFFRALKNLASLSGADSPEAYVFGIARNVSLEVHRKRRPVLPINEEMVYQDDSRMALHLEIKNLVANLPDIYRETLELRVGRDLSYAEISQVLDIPVGTVRSRIFYALHILRKRVGPELEI